MIDAFNKTAPPAQDVATFFAACQTGDVGVISTILMRYPTAVNWVSGADDKTGLMIAAENGHLAATMAIVVAMANTNAKIDQGNSKGSTALMLSAKGGHVKVMKLLLDFKALPNIANENGTTALMAAAWHGTREACSLLIERGADVDAQDASQMTSLMYAASEQRVDATSVLLYAGANKDLRNDEYQSAEDIARTSGYHTLAHDIGTFEYTPPAQAGPSVEELLEDFQSQAEEVVRKLEDPAITQDNTPAKKSSVSSFADKLKKGGLI